MRNFILFFKIGGGRGVHLSEREITWAQHIGKVDASRFWRASKHQLEITSTTVNRSSVRKPTHGGSYQTSRPGLEVLNALTSTGKKKKLSAAKQREVRDLGAELAYHQHLLEQARATIAEAENRNRALQEDRAVAEEKLQSAATAVVAANADRDRTIIQANAFAYSTI